MQRSRIGNKHGGAERNDAWKGAGGNKNTKFASDFFVKEARIGNDEKDTASQNGPSIRFSERSLTREDVVAP